MTLVHDLQGPINVGDVFVWEPLEPCSEVIRVTRVESRNGETRIESERETFHSSTGFRHWNDEDRFREACVRVPIRHLDGVESHRG